jgi:hypothetical protein
MNNVVLNCHHCGMTVPLRPGDKIGRARSCDRCGADLHCCRCCRFFDTSKNNQCAEPQAEWVSDKEKSNFCDYFEPRTTIDLVRRSGSSEQDARKKFDSLFKKL